MQLHPAELLPELQRRLLGGGHLTLYGPRGGGKSTVLAALHAQLARAGIPCALATSTASLDDITSALERAYPAVDTLDATRRAARARLWNAADRRAGVLLLDHFFCVSNAMVSFLRRLHGKIAGVLTAVDVDDERERGRMRPWRYGAMSVRMPLTSTPHLRRMFYSRCRSLGLPLIDITAEQRLLKAARGRPGWIVKCAELARESRYWCEHGLLLSVLCVDTEAAVRYRALDMLRPAVNSTLAPGQLLSAPRTVTDSLPPTAGRQRPG